MNRRFWVSLRVIKLSILLVLLSSLGSTFAATRGFDLRLGAYTSNLGYDEDNGVSNSGNTIGLVARYASYQPLSTILLDLTYVGGRVDYKGAGKISDIKSELYDARGMFGFSFYLNNAYRLTPYVGIGLRHFVADSRSDISTTSVAGYKSEQIYVYNPIGIEIIEVKEITDATWVTGWRLEYDSVFWGQNRSRLGAADAYEAVKVSQSGHGYRFYMSFHRFFGEDGSGIMIEPFYKYWHLSDSESNEYPGFSSDHESSEWGVSLLFSF